MGVQWVFREHGRAHTDARSRAILLSQGKKWRKRDGEVMVVWLALLSKLNSGNSNCRGGGREGNGVMRWDGYFVAGTDLSVLVESVVC